MHLIKGSIIHHENNYNHTKLDLPDCFRSGKQHSETIRNSNLQK